MAAEIDMDSGVLVPHRKDTKARILDITARMPQMSFIGWDLVITENGCSCIEANSPPGLTPWQVHQPLLSDPRCRRFFEVMGVTAKQ